MFVGLFVCLSGYRIEGIRSDRRQNSHTGGWTKGAAGRKEKKLKK